MAKARQDAESKKIMAQDDKAPKRIQNILEFLNLLLPMTLAKRLVNMILIVAGVPIARCMELTGTSAKTTYALRKAIGEEEDLSKLLTLKNGTNKKSKTANIEEQIIAEIESNNYHTLRQIANMIKEKFKVTVSQWTVGRFLKKKGIKRLKCGSLPAKADVEEQEKFYNGTLKPLMEAAKKGTTVLLFVDASHFVMGCDFLGYIYSFMRRLLKTASGRRRYNVLGAMDFVSKSVLAVSNDTYITASEVCDMLRKIAEAHPGKIIHVILDNARYQKCKAVLELAAQLHIQLVYLPPYSPNLNLIERLWRFVKSELRAKYYDDFGIYQQAIDSIISSTTHENKARIEKLIGEKVQLYSNLRFIAKDTAILDNSEGKKSAA